MVSSLPAFLSNDPILDDGSVFMILRLLTWGVAHADGADDSENRLLTDAVAGCRRVKSCREVGVLLLQSMEHILRAAT